MACINPVILFPARHPTGLFHGSEGAGRGEGEPLRAAAVREQLLQPAEGWPEDSAPARHSEAPQGAREAPDALHEVQQEDLGHGNVVSWESQSVMLILPGQE